MCSYNSVIGHWNYDNVFKLHSKSERFVGPRNNQLIAYHLYWQIIILFYHYLNFFDSQENELRLYFNRNNELLTSADVVKNILYLVICCALLTYSEQSLP